MLEYLEILKKVQTECLNTECEECYFGRYDKRNGIHFCNLHSRPYVWIVGEGEKK